VGLEIITEPRLLPSVTKLLEGTSNDSAPHDVWVAAARHVLSEARATILSGGSVRQEDLARAVTTRATQGVAPWPTRVINATGVILHTNLGRAVLSDAARQAMTDAAAYSDLEVDLQSGIRGFRDTHIERLLVDITGAEAATVTNNCAASLFLALTALGRGRDVVVSRGQSVEIGGKFRIPDVCAQSGATLREVGTTNRTYASDYDDAVSEQTALLLKVHRSNFSVSGFVADVDIADMARIGRERSVPVVNDLGSGCLVDTTRFDLRHEPTVQESVAAGAGLTLFSGDKLLGGPQAGLIVGRSDLVDRLRRHPLARALRCDKVTLAAMYATLRHYARGEEYEHIPTLRMLGLTEDEIQARAEHWRDAVHLAGIAVCPSASMVGGGSLPDVVLPSAALVLDPTVYGLTSNALTHRLRTGATPVMARSEQDRVWLDPRTVQPDEEPALLAAIHLALESPSPFAATPARRL
jgi:L-seryl-tRNA(Ser) seleniumtransferase